VGPEEGGEQPQEAQVSFEEAKIVFADVNHIIRHDDDNADGEARIAVIGFSSGARVLFVVAFEVEQEFIRIIGARRAEPQELIQYAIESQK
jgi:uncharacterized DUF497 family protein